MNRVVASVLVSYTCNDDTDKALLLVGQKQPGKDISIVNAFQGKEANELWQKLTMKKEEK